MEKIEIHTETIQLDQCLKLAGVVATGGAVRPMIEDGIIFVNGVLETARRKKLSPGDVVTLRVEDGDMEYQIVSGA